MKDGIDMVIMSAVLMCISVAIVFYSINQPTGYAVAITPEETMESFVNCVYEDGATLYITDGCSNCEEQKAMFGGKLDGLKYVICEDRCERSDVTNFPTWTIKGRKYEGALSLKDISELTGCSL